MVWRSLPNIAFSDVKQLLVGCREQLGEKGTEVDSKVSHFFKTVNLVVLKCKKKLRKFLFEKLTEMSNLILGFPKIPKVFICFCLREMASFIWGLKKVDLLEKCPLNGFCLSSISPWLYKCGKGKHIYMRFCFTPSPHYLQIFQFKL